MRAISKVFAVVGLVLILLAGFGSTPKPGAQAEAENWDNREIFSSGLISSEQQTLSQLPGASIYHITVTIADDYSSLDGQERVRYTNQENVALESIYFQLFPNMKGGQMTVSGAQVNSLALDPVYAEQNNSLRLDLNTALEPGESLIVQLDFNVQIPPQAAEGIALFGFRDSTLLLDGFYPAIPVYDDQGWHKGLVPENADTTFQDASFYTVQVTAPAALKLVTSGVEVERTEIDTRQVLSFAAGPARDFYLAGSEGFVAVSAMVGETLVNSYTLAVDAEASKLALGAAVNAFKVFNERLGPYPYREFDVVGAPILDNVGIEYPGMTVINSVYYKIDLTGEQTDLITDYMLETTIAHEVAHQWFYNLVGNDQINQPWIDESLTEYMTGLYYLDQDGQQSYDEFRGLWLDNLGWVEQPLTPIGRPAGSYSSNDYGGIVYGRGPLFMEALAQKLGPDGFERFLRDYIQSLRWGISSEAIFKQAAEQECQCDLSPLFQEWVDG